MKNWKAYVALLFAFCLVVAMVACSDPAEETPTGDGTSATAGTSESAVPAESSSEPAASSSEPAASSSEPAASSSEPAASSSEPAASSSEPVASSSEPTSESTPVEPGTSATTLPSYAPDDEDPFVVDGSTPETEESTTNEPAADPAN